MTSLSFFGAYKSDVYMLALQFLVLALVASGLRVLREESAMSQEQVRQAAEPFEDGELWDSSSCSPGVNTHNGDSQSSRGKTTTKKTRRSRYTELEQKFDKKFETVDYKLDRLYALFSSKKDDKSSKNVKRTYISSDEESDTCERGNDDDVLSLYAKSDKFDSDNRLSDNEESVPTEGNISSKTQQCLHEMFGDDAKVATKAEKIGLRLDDSQKEVIQNGYRCTEPSFLSAFNENVMDLFPVDQDTETFLQVPPLDPLIETCLIKRHGSKAAFSSSKARGKGLFSQPCKLVERIAYKGSHAARLGIIIQSYIQQSLGNLLQNLQGESFDKDKAVSQVKDIFSMTTKGLDQIGRAGAFHHIIRRSLAMTDTALYELSDASKFQNLPLSGEGVFGTGLETMLKARKEQKKQLEELVPELKKKDSYKRKQYSSSDQEPPYKKTYTEKPAAAASSDNFRIPKVPSADERYSSQYDRGRSTYRGGRSNFPRSSSRGRGRADKK